MRKILLIGLLIVAMTGTGWAYSSSDHTAQADGLVGDCLIYPVYAADGSGWETWIKVINTSHTDCTVAKVVIRGADNSQELLDFFIYLSPTDEWTGKLYNSGGTVYIYSTDDSVRSGVGVWADETALNFPLQDKSCDQEGFGYVVIYDAWHASLTEMDDNDLDGTIPVDKDDILTAFEDGLIGYFESSNILTGWFEVNLPTLGLGCMENAVVLMDYDIDQELSLGAETFMGQRCRNSEGEVEAALAKDWVGLPFYNGANITAHVLTFPTKEAQPDEDDNSYLEDDTCEVDEPADVQGPFFKDWGDQTEDNNMGVTYGFKYFDLEENTPTTVSPIFSPVPEEEKQIFKYEVNILVANLPPFTNNSYDEGWALYTFQLDQGMYTSDLTDSGNESVVYTGAPVIPLSVNIGADGLAMKYGFFESGYVYYEEE